MKTEIILPHCHTLCSLTSTQILWPILNNSFTIINYNCKVCFSLHCTLLRLKFTILALDRIMIDSFIVLVIRSYCHYDRKLRS
jgi:hypothetical protein